MHKRGFEQKQQGVKIKKFKSKLAVIIRGNILGNFFKEFEFQINNFPMMHNLSSQFDFQISPPCFNSHGIAQG